MELAMDADTIFKIVQAVFYAVAGTVAVLTYRSAKSGLLNPINTEYHKRIIDRLAMLSEELYQESERASPVSRPGNALPEELISILDEVNDEPQITLFSPDKSGQSIGHPSTKELDRLLKLSLKHRTDPFIP